MALFSLVVVLAGLLGLFAVGVGLYVFCAGRETQIRFRDLVSRSLTLLWAVPVVAVCALFLNRAVPSLTPRSAPVETRSEYAKNTAVQPKVFLDGKPIPDAQISFRPINQPDFVAPQDFAYSENFGIPQSRRDVSSIRLRRDVTIVAWKGLVVCLALFAGGFGLFMFFKRRRRESLHDGRSFRWIWIIPVAALCLLFVPRALFSLRGVTSVQPAVEYMPSARPQPAADSHDSELDLGDSETFGQQSIEGSALQESTPENETQPTDSSDTSPETAVAATTASHRPDWVDQPATTDNQTTLLVLASGHHSNIEDCNTEILNLAVLAVKNDFEQFYDNQGPWNLPGDLVVAEAIRYRYKDQQKFETGVNAFKMHRVYAQIELSPEVRKAVFPIWREQIVGRRLWIFGGLVGLVTLMFGTSTAYLRLNAQTSGAYRGRLRMAAVSLIVAGGLIAATAIPI